MTAGDKEAIRQLYSILEDASASPASTPEVSTKLVADDALRKELEHSISALVRTAHPPERDWQVFMSLKDLLGRMSSQESVSVAEADAVMDQLDLLEKESEEINLERVRNILP